ncbi:lysophospholipid acyltransferase family protein [candidate division KSB1 bacterium]|nr:lysophospholipid acyltransferase family protein [candidate division KSB1 bacterium]
MSDQTVKVSLRLRLKQLRRRITYSSAFIAFLSGLAIALIRTITVTLKIDYRIHPEASKLQSPRYLYGFWHGDLFLLVSTFSKEKICLMTAPTWAADILTRVLLNFGYRVVRGSHKKQAVRGLLEMKRSVQEGYIGSLALDGPSGPRQRAKPGMIYLARKLELPIVPVACMAERAWIFERTWDRFYLPKPFSRCTVVIGKPIHAVYENPDFSTTDLDALQMEVTREAMRLTGQEKNPGLAPS